MDSMVGSVLNYRKYYMSTKNPVYHDAKTESYLYTKLDFDSGSPAYIEIYDPTEASIERIFNGKVVCRLAIDASVMDEFAVNWCEQRKLHARLGGPVGKEFGSPDSDYE